MHQAEVLRKAGHKQWEIAEMLGVSDRMVRYYLNPKPEAQPAVRQSLLDPYHEYITAKIDEAPNYNLVVLRKELVAQGYSGGMTILRVRAKQVRDEVVKRAVIRFETMPAQQAQVDWKEAGVWEIDGVQRKVYAFVMLLGYSRRAYVRFTVDMKSPTLLACHIEAFKHFAGVVREILYDNMKTAWLNRGGVWEVHPALLAFAAQCSFEPKRCKVRRPQTKGKVERFIGYLGNHFLPMARNMNLTSIDDLNSAVNGWLEEVNEEPIRAFCETRNERFERERTLFTPFVPAAAPDIRASEEVVVSLEGTIRFETNRYSVPARYLGKVLTLRFHPLTRDATLYDKDSAIRSFTLLPKGSRSTGFRDVDRKELVALWHRQTQAHEKKGVPHAAAASDVDVDTRHPAWYERLLTEVAV
ncbi:MAG TPA: IS21 family transposase [Treponemataceae bacterium]|nr:IS21 family transposase [Treponemataceae bacterium]